MDIHYIAGFFDGEGCISVRFQKPTSYVIEIAITNTKRSILKLIQDEIGGTIQAYCPPQKHWNIRYQLKFSAQKAVQFLNLIEPHLILKKEQAQLALELNNLIVTRQGYGHRPVTVDELAEREYYRQAIRDLQRRPVS